MKLAVSRGALPVLLWCTVTSFADQAEACSPDEPYLPYVTEVSEDMQPPELQSADVSIRRAENAGQAKSDCTDLGTYHVVMDASDEHTPTADLGYVLRRVSGSLPFALPEGPVHDAQGDQDLSVWFQDEGNAFQGVIEVRAVDRAGNESEPVEVRVADDAVGCSCSMPGRALGGQAVWGLVGVLTLAYRRRRRPLLQH